MSANVVAFLVLSVALAANELLAQHWRLRAQRRRLLLLVTLAALSVSRPTADRAAVAQARPDAATTPEPVAGASVDGGATDGPRQPRSMLAADAPAFAAGEATVSIPMGEVTPWTPAKLPVPSL